MPQNFEGVTPETCTPEHVVAWLKANGEAGNIPKGQAGHLANAVSRLAEFHEGDDTARAMLDDIEGCCTRWRNRELAKETTIGPARGRAKRALEAALAWFGGDHNVLKELEPKSVNRSRKSNGNAVPTALANRVDLRDDRVFEYAVPNGGLTDDEVRRIAVALVAAHVPGGIDTPLMSMLIEQAQA